MSARLQNVSVLFGLITYTHEPALQSRLPTSLALPPRSIQIDTKQLRIIMISVARIAANFYPGSPTCSITEDTPHKSHRFPATGIHYRPSSISG